MSTLTTSRAQHKHVNQAGVDVEARLLSPGVWSAEVDIGQGIKPTHIIEQVAPGGAWKVEELGPDNRAETLTKAMELLASRYANMGKAADPNLPVGEPAKVQGHLLPMHELINLFKIVTLAQNTGEVTFLDENGQLSKGTAQSIGDEYGHFLATDRDVRDGYLRIVMQDGQERFEKISDLTEQLGKTFFA